MQEQYLWSVSTENRTFVGWKRNIPFLPNFQMGPLARYFRSEELTEDGGNGEPNKDHSTYFPKLGFFSKNSFSLLMSLYSMNSKLKSTKKKGSSSAQFASDRAWWL